ncbi:MAG TPA: thiaminase II [Thermohalobaculum sp.]|nr:thiaminase II [Thermohalobaculum sp.]
MSPPTEAPDFGSAVFRRWRAAAADDWAAYVGHEFVRGLADGSLPRARFLHYLRQDYVFLIHFARAWALAVVKAKGLDEMRVAAATVEALVGHEMRLHVETCAAEGISEAELEATAEAPENMAYTRYVLEAGYSGDFLDLMAALAPCVLGYGEIGARLIASDPAETYAPWIGTYGGDEYQGLCREVGGLIDRAAADRLGADPERNPRWPRLADHFRNATRLEGRFWAMGLGR